MHEIAFRNNNRWRNVKIIAIKSNYEPNIASNIKHLPKPKRLSSHKKILLTFHWKKCIFEYIWVANKTHSVIKLAEFKKYRPR
jgi:hypothetical protein